MGKSYLQAVQGKLKAHLKQEKEHSQLGQLLQFLLIPEKPAGRVLSLNVGIYIGIYRLS